MDRLLKIIAFHESVYLKRKENDNDNEYNNGK